MVKNQFSARTLTFLIITLLAIVLRLFISFSTDLFFGTNGGYYPLQVRCVLNTGLLGFNDVPLYFYFCAFIIKFISLFGHAATNETIILVIKVIDCIALPLLVIPLFKMLSNKETKIPFFSEIAIVLFAVFSFSPFAMLGDIQKNAFAIPFLFMFMYLFERFLRTGEKRNLLFALLTLFLTALAHFGVFTFGIAFLIVSLSVVYRKKAIIPSVIAFLVGFAVILLFDSTRAYRLLTFWNIFFVERSMFQAPNLLPLLVNCVVSYSLAIFGFFQYRKFKNQTDIVTQYLVLILSIYILIFAFPLYKSDYVQRFSILLFIPQILLIVNLIRMNTKLALPFSIPMILLTAYFTFGYLKDPKKPCIDNFEFQDLKNIKSYISENKDSTIIIAKHGLEFWTAWALNVKVGNERAMNQLDTSKYKNIIILQQKNELRERPPKRPPFPLPFHKPPIQKNGQPPMELRIPENFTLIYSSQYFNAYRN